MGRGTLAGSDGGAGSGAAPRSKQLRVVDARRRRLQVGTGAVLIDESDTKVWIVGFGKPSNGIIEIKAKTVEGQERVFFGEETQAGKYSCGSLVAKFAPTGNGEAYQTTTEIDGKRLDISITPV